MSKGWKISDVMEETKMPEMVVECLVDKDDRKVSDEWLSGSWPLKPFDEAVRTNKRKAEWIRFRNQFERIVECKTPVDPKTRVAGLKIFAGSYLLSIIEMQQNSLAMTTDIYSDTLQEIRTNPSRICLDQFFNYKKTFSIVLLGIVDANYNFIFADVGCQGRISDGGVFTNSPIYARLERRELNIPAPEILQPPYKMEVPYYLLGDQAFAMKEYCLRPYGGMHAADSIERNFNYRHSRARRVVENAFGIAVKVWRVLSKPIELEPHVAEKVVMATIHLHNFRRRHLLYNYTSAIHLPSTRSTESSSAAPNENSDEELPSSMLSLPAIPLRPTRALQNMRSHLAQHFKANDPLPFSLPHPQRQ
ncbi:uncharacterized protein LOC131292869 [Anopheles ziemanni]|uniref:uncharacterized protein LOC131271212 n=1 Tax=Anopheles coustani TaxID=139045 RepID=UPI002658FB11|nr:uncharacterized protein LOC131271212 [Anopheles coustani]XP_058176945.1 uncharacterized protein LOC131292869 [Anopheles ziemanni]